jgi:hypothetical protein
MDSVKILARIETSGRTINKSKLRICLFEKCYWFNPISSSYQSMEWYQKPLSRLTFFPFLEKLNAKTSLKIIIVQKWITTRLRTFLFKKASNRKEFKNEDINAHKKTMYQQNVWVKFLLKTAYMYMNQITQNVWVKFMLLYHKGIIVK